MRIKKYESWRLRNVDTSNLLKIEKKESLIKAATQLYSDKINNF